MFSVSYTAIFIVSYILSAFSVYILWSVCTTTTRYLTYFMTSSKVLNCLVLFMWNIVLQPEFLEEVICLRMHGIASNLSKYGIHLCVCAALVIIKTVGINHVHIGIYYLLSFCFPDLEKLLFSVKYLSIAFFVYLFNGTLIFALVYESVNLEAFPTKNNVVCYMFSSQQHSKYIVISSCALMGCQLFLATVMITLVLRSIRKNQTTANKEKIRNVTRTMIVFSLIPIVMAVIPFASIFIWSLFVNSSRALALFSNVASHVAVLYYSVLTTAALFRIKTYRCAVLNLLPYRTVVQPIAIRSTDMAN
uniref:G_PROTEIN_RECEP_F1_2 domain-containing protein n=1 Tax=Steinernema glaseri TaxID=37863 RepID=A0A1I7Y4Y2_9BILA